MFCLGGVEICKNKENIVFHSKYMILDLLLFQSSLIYIYFLVLYFYNIVVVISTWNTGTVSAYFWYFVVQVLSLHLHTILVACNTAK